jgi:hypothetical protein
VYKMTRMLRLAPLILAAAPAWADAVPVPSGQKVELIEAFWDLADETTPTLRLRFLAPEIGDGRTHAEVEKDFPYLCQTLALPSVPPERDGALIVLSLSDRPVPFGTFDPDATQFFEGFRADSGSCVWEPL